MLDQAFGHDFSETAQIIAGSMCSMGILCSLEMLVLTACTFNRWRGLYFWSMMMASTAFTCFGIGTIFTLWESNNAMILAGVCLATPGNFFGVVGIFLMYYSRLKLVLANRKLQRIILYIIILEIILVEIPTNMFAAIVALNPNSVLLRTSDIWWQIELFCFIALNLSMNILFIHRVKRHWYNGGTPAGFKVFKQLLAMLAFNVAIDITFAVGSYKINSNLIQSIGLFLFGFKLKVEILTLRQLTDLANSQKLQCSNNFGVLEKHATSKTVIGDDHINTSHSQDDGQVC